MAKQTEPSAEKRRVPTQERSRARVARMLDAATEVFAEVGFDAATTEAIAERAGTSIGSVYQFFPNKKALFDAIGERYLSDARDLCERFLTEAAERAKDDWRALIDEVVDAFWAFDSSSTAFRAVWINIHRSQEFLAQGDAFNQEMAERIAPLLGAVAPNIKPAKRLLVATIVVETLSSLLFLALRRDERTAKKLVEETKVLVRGYLERYAESE
ncbi:MAG: TetR/AcrR family transcriptional regulator [Polyangiales bacterium]